MAKKSTLNEEVEEVAAPVASPVSNGLKPLPTEEVATGHPSRDFYTAVNG